MDHMDHTMSMSMSMSSTGTATAPMSTGTSMDMGGMGHDMGGMGHDMGGMGHDMGGSCKISMLWNWNTIDACFLSSSWHITSKGMFAGSCIGVILLVMSLEFLRRLGREYDSFIVRRARMRAKYLDSDSNTSSAAAAAAATGGAGTTTSAEPASCCLPDSSENSNSESTANKTPYTTSQTNTNANTNASSVPFRSCSEQLKFRPSPIEQTVRALLHMVQFAVAYFVMLLAMYFNGYIIICIFIGAFLGAMVFSWEEIGERSENDATAVTKCCG